MTPGSAITRLTALLSSGGDTGIRGLLRVLARLGWLQRRRLGPALLAAAALSALALAPPALLAHLIDRSFPSSDVKMVMAIGLALAGIALLDAGMAFLRRILAASAGLAVRRDILVPSFAAMLRLPVDGAHARDQGVLGQTFEEAERLARGASEEVIEIALGVGTVFALSIVMLIVDATLGLVVLGLVVGLAGLHLVAARRLRSREAAWFEARSRYWSHLVESIAFAETVRFNSAHGFAERRYAERLDSDIRANRAVIGLSSGLDAAGRFAGGLMIAAIALLGGLGVIDGRMSVGDFVLFLAIGGSLASPVLGLVKALDDLQAMTISTARLSQLASADHEAIPSEASIIEARGPVGLAANGLTFRFDNRSEAILDGLSFKIEPGEKVAVLGPSGVGKSTLASLLFRARKPDEGLIALDGISVEAIPLETLRRRIVVVPHQIDVFTGSIAENIALAVPGASIDDITNVASVAALDRDIRDLPDGYQTLLGQGGLDLSAGQKQRLGIARALLAAPDVLILDESTSSLDLDTEERVLDGLLQHLAGATIVAITHRTSVARRMDRSIRLASPSGDREA